MDITNQQAALLGLLCEREMHAYQIEKEVESRSMRTWTDLSMSAIYKTLRTLDAAGLTHAEVRLTEQNVAQKVHRVTDSGRKALAGKVRELLRGPQPVKDPVDLAFNNLSILPTADAIGVLEKYRIAVEELLVGYTNLREYLIENACPPFRLALATRRQALYRGELEWLDSYIDSVRQNGSGHVEEGT